jgi:hypothetical protein
VTPLERHCGWLLHAYPAWYRRERAGEMLGTLLETSPPGRRWPSFRDARTLIIGGLRARGWTFFLTILWAGLGAAGAGYDFMVSMHVSQVNARIPAWVGEPGLVINLAFLGGAAWLLLTFPVLAAGLVRLRRTGRAAWWVTVWIAGLLLIIPIGNWQTSAPPVMSGNCWKGDGCVLAGYRYAVVSWGELAVLAGWIALEAAIVLILTGTAPTRALRTPDQTVAGA